MLVHRFKLGDVEDAQIYAAGPLMDWQRSESGRWIMENALQTPMWKTCDDLYNWGSAVEVHADLTPEDEVYFLLRWGDEIESR